MNNTDNDTPNMNDKNTLFYTYNLSFAIEKTEEFTDECGGVFGIGAGPKGWAVCHPNALCTFTSSECSTDENFKKAVEYVTTLGKKLTPVNGLKDSGWTPEPSKKGETDDGDEAVEEADVQKLDAKTALLNYHLHANKDQMVAEGWLNPDGTPTEKLKAEQAKNAIKSSQSRSIDLIEQHGYFLSTVVGSMIAIRKSKNVGKFDGLDGAAALFDDEFESTTEALKRIGRKFIETAERLRNS